MPVAVREMLAIKSPRGDVVHITSLSSPGRTACGKKCNGWKLAPVARAAWKIERRHVDCLACKAKVFLPVRARGNK